MSVTRTKIRVRLELEDPGLVVWGPEYKDPVDYSKCCLLVDGRGLCRCDCERSNAKPVIALVVIPLAPEES